MIKLVFWNYKLSVNNFLMAMFQKKSLRMIKGEQKKIIPVAKPNTYNLFFHTQTIGQRGYLFGSWLGIDAECVLERTANRRLDRGAFFSSPADRFGRSQRIIQRTRIVHRTIGVRQPFL